MRRNFSSCCGPSNHEELITQAAAVTEFTSKIRHDQPRTCGKRSGSHFRHRTRYRNSRPQSKKPARAPKRAAPKAKTTRPIQSEKTARGEDRIASAA